MRKWCALGEYLHDKACIPERFSGQFFRLGRWLRQEGEGPNLLCWFAVCFGIGDILFFRSNGDAALIWPALATGLFLSMAWLCRVHRKIFHIATALLAMSLGFTCGTIRLHRAETPVLDKTVIGAVTGHIESVEYRIGRSTQLVILPTALADLPSDRIPKRIRVTLRSGTLPAAGNFISAKMRLLPLPQPVRPSGYDFARDSYFKGIGAVGSILGKPDILSPEEGAQPLGLRFDAAIDKARNDLTKRIYDTVGGEAGGVAAALVTGKRGYIPEETNEVLRAAGIYHIVSISGLHMVIAAGIVFWVVRAVLALFSIPALYWPVKKIAAGFALFGAVGYCLFSGAEVATQRALIMTLIMFGAILADRRALSMRNLAIAALIILITTPEALLGPGFQMSFAAVAALITLAHASKNLSIALRGNWFMRSVIRGANWSLALVATTLVAGLATAPFAAYHFQTAVPFGLIGNALALPLVSLIVMPMGALGALAYLFSLDQPMWLCMGAATAAVVDVSRWVASLEGSLLHFPAFGSGAVLMAALSLVVATVLTTPLRYGAVIPIILAFLWAAAPERYLAFVDRDGRAVAVRGTNGKLFILGNANGFLTEQWLRADGDDRETDDESLFENRRCDRSGCVGKGMLTVALVRHPSAFQEDCKRADVIVSRFSAPKTCAAGLVIDRGSLSNGGAAAVKFIDGDRLGVVHAREAMQAWPWFPKQGISF